MKIIPEQGCGIIYGVGDLQHDLEKGVSAVKKRIKHFLIVAGGWVFIILGILGLFLPILQGILFLIIGFYLLSHEYHWAKRIFSMLKNRYPRIFMRFKELKKRF
jgi:hypothetical protein